MKKFIEIIKKKWLRQTTLTILLIAIILVAFVSLNLWIQSLDLTPIDFTKEKLYTLSDESKDLIKDINQEVTIYFFGFLEDSSIVNLAKQYGKEKDNIKVECIQYSQRPDLAQKYEVSSEDDIKIVVQAPERYKVLTTSDLYTYDMTTYETIDITEQKLTNTIIDTTIARKPTIYFLTGHQEYTLDQDLATLQQELINDVNEVKTLDLLITEFPTDCDVLVIATPLKDFSDSETEKILNYIQNGGKILWLNDPTIEETNFPNIKKILDIFGLSFSKGMILETDASKMLIQNPQLIIPEVLYHSITTDIYTSGGVMFASPGRINIVEEEKLNELGVTTTPIIKSSEKSIYREDFTITSMNKTDKDEQGSFIVGAEFEKKIDDEKSAKLIAYSSNLFASDARITSGNQAINIIYVYNNKDLALNSVAYLSNRSDSIRIRKDTGTITYTATEQQNKIVKAIIFAVPVIIIIIGIIVWQIRRRKK